MNKRLILFLIVLTLSSFGVFVYLDKGNVSTSNNEESKKEAEIEKSNQHTSDVDSKKALSEVEYVKYVNNVTSGLYTSSEDSGFKFELQYLPINLLALKEYKNADLSSQEDYDSLRLSYGKYNYLTLKISNEYHRNDLLSYLSKVSSVSEHGVIEHYSLGAQKFIKLKTETGNELDCTIYHLEYIKGVSPALKLMIGFENIDGSIEDLVVSYQDPLLNIEALELTIPKERIAKIPQLKISL